MRQVVFLVLLSLAVPACSPSAGPTAPSRDGAPATPDAAGPLVAGLFAEVNAHRQSQGLAPLAWHPVAAAVAQAHSEDMVRRGYFAHVDPDGHDPADRLAAANVAYWNAAENIVSDAPTAGAALAAWLASDGHRANLESTEYTHQGIGVVNGTWTHVFVTPR